MTNDKLIECAVEVAKSAISGAQNPTALLNKPEAVAKLIGTVYAELAKLDAQSKGE